MWLKGLGRSLVRVSAIGQGTSYNFKKCSSEKIIDTLRLGIELGNNLIDTAENYGEGCAEEFVGRAIRGYRNRVIIATKFSPQNSSQEKVSKALDNSLTRLKTDHVDLYQFHWPNSAIPTEETLGALDNAVKNGKIRFIGLGNFSLSEIIKAWSTNLPIVSLQTEYNLFERTIEQNGILDWCNANKLSIIAYSPLDQGRLGGMSNPQKLLLETLALKHDATVAQIILRWLVDRPQVIAIPKTVNRQHIIENCQSASVVLSVDDIEKINKQFFAELKYVSVDRIRVSLAGEENQQVYQTIEEAKENKLDFTPSPNELAFAIREGGFIKPVRLIRSEDKKYDYDLINGRVRYWAWVIAFNGTRPIPAYVRKNL